MIKVMFITFLVWNVHGLPLPKLTNAAKSNELKQYVESVDYDMLLAQEVWTRKTRKALKHNKWSHWQSDAGLLTIAPSAWVGGAEHHKFKYTTFSRWDFLSAKGFSTFLVHTPKNEILFINTHLDSGEDRASEIVRLTQVEHIIDEVRSYPGPIVLVGDLNLKIGKSSIDQRVLLRLIEGLNLGIVVKNDVDYVLASRGFKVKTTKILPKGPSDHQPILVTMEMNWNGKK